MQTPSLQANSAYAAAAPVPEPGPLVAVDAVTKRYGAFRLALSDVSLTIGRGEFVHVIGPSGVGKSTLLRLIAGLELPTNGRVLVAGEDTARMKRSARALMRRSMGIVLQEPLLLEDRSVLHNVMLAAYAAGAQREQADSRARAALSRTGIDDVNALPQELSAGQQQRVAVARALVNRPALLLADEPSAHLDTASAAGLLQLLEQFAVAGVAIVLASHGVVPAKPVLARYRRFKLDHGKLMPVLEGEGGGGKAV